MTDEVPGSRWFLHWVWRLRWPCPGGAGGEGSASSQTVPFGPPHSADEAQREEGFARSLSWEQRLSGAHVLCRRSTACMESCPSIAAEFTTWAALPQPASGAERTDRTLGVLGAGVGGGQEARGPVGLGRRWTQALTLSGPLTVAALAKPLMSLAVQTGWKRHP